MSTDPSGDDGSSLAEGGGHSFLPAPPFDAALDTNPPPDLPAAPDSQTQAWQRLINRDIPQDELATFIETTVSGVKTVDIMDCLQGRDAQACIDVIDEVRYPAPPFPRNWSVYSSF